MWPCPADKAHRWSDEEVWVPRLCLQLLILLVNFIYDLANKTVLVKETAVPPSHVTTGDWITSSHIHVASKVLGYIDEFHIEEILIPSDTQINNHLYYCCTLTLNHTNMIEVLEAQLGWLVHKGDEEDCQPFIYFYNKDSQGR
jgi:hypothetical protein